MKDGIGVALDYAARSHSVRSVVVTGAGGAFCAGGDVKQMAAGRDEDGTLDERIYEQRLDHRKTAGRMYAMPKPVIAMIPGPAAGAGLSIALAADMRTMAASSFITTAFARVGFSGDYGGPSASRRAIAMVASSSSSSANTRLAIPSARHSSAPTRSER